MRCRTAAVAAVPEPCANEGHGSLCSPTPAELPSARPSVGEGMIISGVKGGGLVVPP